MNTLYYTYGGVVKGGKYWLSFKTVGYVASKHRRNCTQSVRYLDSGDRASKKDYWIVLQTITT